LFRQLLIAVVLYVLHKLTLLTSLTQRADEEYQTLVQQNPAYEEVIRHVMLRMVAIGGGELARRRVLLDISKNDMRAQCLAPLLRLSDNA
jgi:hypothetical protein